MVSALAYSSYRLPPEKIASLSPNLAIIWSRAEKRRTLYHDPDEVAEYQKLRGEWLAKLPSKQLIMWESYLNAEPKTCSIPAIFPRAIAEDLRGLKGISQGDTVEVYQHQSFSNFRPHDHGYPYDAFALNHLNLYVTARCWWDANLDIDALLEEYCRLYYGPAAGPMRTFIGYSEQHWPGLLKDEAGIARVLKLAEEAQAAVDPGTIYGRRVARVAEYVKPLSSLRKQLNRSRRDDVQRTRAFEVKALAGKKLDGKVDDPEYWPPTRTLYLRDAKLNRRPAPELDSWARVMRAGKDTLCFGVYCADPDMARLNQGAAGEGTVNMLKGDYVEILFETTSHSYYRIRVSPAGKMEEADMGDGAEERRWRSGADFAVHAGTNYWSLELRLPLGGDGLRAEEPLSGVSGRMPSAAFPWYINVGRQRVRAGLVERFTCAPTGSDKFDVPDRFVELMSK